MKESRKYFLIGAATAAAAFLALALCGGGRGEEETAPPVQRFDRAYIAHRRALLRARAAGKRVLSVFRPAPAPVPTAEKQDAPAQTAEAPGAGTAERGTSADRDL